MKFPITLSIALASVAFGERDLCSLNHTGREQRCTIQSKDDVYSRSMFHEAVESYKNVTCSWITDDYLKVDYTAGRAESHLPENIFVILVSNFINSEQ
ncbi:hypothetical protein L0F63_001265, partial [Massospora cicadina]